MTLREYIDRLRGRTVAVIGIGVSNTPLLRLLLREGISVTACDRSDRAKLGALAEELGVSVMPGLAMLSAKALRGGVDTSEWTDVDRNAARPVGNRNVWGGYDPARTGDNASASTLLPPDVSGGLIRLLEKEGGKSGHWKAEA